MWEWVRAVCRRVSPVPDCPISRTLYLVRMGSPDWHGGDTGVQIGIGYDLGARSRYEFIRDWRGLLGDRELAHFAKACGKRGLAAARIIRFYRNVHVPYDAAVTVWRKAKG